MLKRNIKPKILVVLGPTAVGKSDLAVELALKFNGEVISADSRQVYTGLDIGTGKITKKEMKGVPHYLLDVANPKKRFTVAEFQKKAVEISEDILSRGKLPIICGGTGFYIQALVDGVILPDVLPNLELRKKLEEKSCEQLHKMLLKLDPVRAKNIDIQNPVRLIRAIEIAKEIGKVPKIKQKPIFETLLIGLDMKDEVLRDRINIRIEKRIKIGMIREVEKLHVKGLSWKRMDELGLEYRYLSQFLQKKISKQQMIDELQVKIWQYAKRQRVWFKKDERIQWLTPNQKDVKKIEKLIKTFIQP